MELALDASIALFLGLGALGAFAAIWSPPPKDAGAQPIFIGSLSRAAAAPSEPGIPVATADIYQTNAGSIDISEAITITVTARGSQQNIIGGPEIQVEIPYGGTVAQLTNRLTDRYPQLQPFAMVSLNGGMLPQTLPLSDGQAVELMAPHSAGLTFLGKPLPTAEP